MESSLESLSLPSEPEPLPDAFLSEDAAWGPREGS
jgi:hypothetical protein